MKQELIQAALRPLLTVEIAHGHSLVSGATLHDVFISLREKLGERVLVDIVLPTDTLLSKIETIDRTIYFLAGQDGTYTEFGGFVLVDEIALLKKIFDGGWEKLTLARIGFGNSRIVSGTPSGIGVTTLFFDHNLNSQNVGVFLYRISDNALIITTTEPVTPNRVNLIFGTPQNGSDYRVVVMS